MFSRKESLIPTKRPSKSKYDTRRLRNSVHLYRHGEDPPPPPLRDSLAIIGDSAPFPLADRLPKPNNPDDPDDAPYIEYNPDKSLKKAKRVRGEAAQADHEAEEEVEQRRGRQKGREVDPDSEQQEPLMDGEVTISQEGVAPGEIRAYAHRDIKPGE